MERVNKLQRQMSLLAALLHTEVPLTARDLHRQVEGYPEDHVAFRRAFERDKEDLRNLGIPIDIEVTESWSGAVDGYRVRKSDYYLHDLGLDPDETVALSVALRLIRLEGAETTDALWKLGGAQGDPGDSVELAAIALGPIVAEFHQAIASSIAASFGYRGERRTVEPWRLAFRRGHWYVIGWDLARSDQRSFRVDRIEGGVELHPDRPALAERSEPADERQPWEFGDQAEPITARIRVDASHAGWIRRHLGEPAVVEAGEDGAVVVELSVTSRDGFRSLVLGMMESAEVLSPPELRSDVVDWLEALVGTRGSTR